MKKATSTIDYYNKNAEIFFQDSISIDMKDIYEVFLKLLPNKSHILDAGCGSGRDSLLFIQHGYKVTAIDPSVELSKLASKLIKQSVLNISFKEIEFENEFDGIWASASLLHTPKAEINDVPTRISKALKQYGVLYASFKYGNKEYEKDGRYFNCYDEHSFIQLINRFKNLQFLKTWISKDLRPNRNHEKWLNCLTKKT